MVYIITTLLYKVLQLKLFHRPLPQPFLLAVGPLSVQPVPRS